MLRPPLRVAVVETSSYGGLLHYATQLADGLAGRGLQVDLLVSRRQELAHHDGPARRVGLFAAPSRDPRAPVGRLRYLLRRAGIAVRLTRALAAVLRRLRREPYDVVVLQWGLHTAVGRVAARRLLARRERPLVAYVLHNVRPLDQVGQPVQAVRGRAGVAAVLARCDLVLVHGEHSLADYRRTWPPADVVVVPHGDQSVFAAQPPPPAGGQGLLFFGDWRTVKGLPVLLEAFALLTATHPDAHLTVAGNPVPADLDDAPVRAFAAQRPHAVRLVDRYVPVEEVPALFAAARVVVTPYLAGYQSGVAHLAMTMGRAVVTSDVGDLGDAVGHGVGGLVVPPGDAPALAEALRQLLDDPARTDELGAAARRRVAARSSWAGVAETVEAAVRRRLDAPAGVPTGNRGGPA